MHTLSSDPAMGTWVLQIHPTKGVAIPICQHFWTWSMLRQIVWIVQRGIFSSRTDSVGKLGLPYCHSDLRWWHISMNPERMTIVWRWRKMHPQKKHESLFQLEYFGNIFEHENFLGLPEELCYTASWYSLWDWPC